MGLENLICHALSNVEQVHVFDKREKQYDFKSHYTAKTLKTGFLLDFLLDFIFISPVCIRHQQLVWNETAHHCTTQGPVTARQEGRLLTGPI